ncbi:MAG: hypothetical protein CFE21_21875 [Bacteroidetes bacterium B1(2017)]|nr:MAG: hypothetical protein CFE21_21875 [Bacteroidetes bacterium B1(2017)]
MKNILKSSKIVVSVFVISLFLLLSCKDLLNIDPTKDLKLMLNYKPADSYIEAQVKDANTGKIISDNITIQIIGTHTDKITNFEGEAKTLYTKKGPSVYIGLKKLVPSQENPVDFKVLISANGYLKTSQNIRMTSLSALPIDIFMVKLSDLPEGATAKQSNVSTKADGAVAQNQVVAVQNGSLATNLNLSEGTIGKDNQGNIVSGILQTTMVSFSGGSAEARKSFPGGNTITMAETSTGEKNVRGSLIPKSFVSIEMKNSEGKKATTFNKNLGINIEITEKTINPYTKTIAKVGDKFPVYTYNEDLGTWKYDGDGTVEQKNGKLSVNFLSNHLSWFGITEHDYYSFTEQIISIGLDTFLPESIQRSADQYNGTLWFPVEEFIETDGILDQTTGIYMDSPPTTEFRGKGFVGGDKRGRIFEGKIQVMKFTDKIYRVKRRYLRVFFDKFYTIEMPLSVNVASYALNFTVPKDIKSKTATIFIQCENACPIQLFPYNMSIEYSENNVDWSYLGAIYQGLDKSIQLFMPFGDNKDLWLRAIAYPEYPLKVNTGTGLFNFQIPLTLSKTHPACNCN